MMIDTKNLTIAKVKDLLDKKEISSVNLTNEYLNHIKEDKKSDKSLKAYISVTEEEAIGRAEAFDKSNPKDSTVAGIPMALKDNIITKGIKTTAGSKILENYIPPYNATVSEKLFSSPLLGKANLDSFAFGSSTENSGFFVTHNPWDYNRVPGGSSGGSAAAVAGDLALFALGTDTGGSVRLPAAFCGIVGLKPTYGRCSRYGLIAMGSSFDVPGVLAKTVEDSAIVLEQIAGYDEKDGTTVDEKIDKYSDFSKAGDNAKKMKVGIPKEFFGEGLDPKIKELIEKEIKRIETLGAEIVEVSLPYSKYSLPVYYVLVPSEISTNISRYDGIRYGYRTEDIYSDLFEMYEADRDVLEDEVKRRIMIGTFALSSGYYDAYYNKASQVRALIIREFNEVFEKVDALVAPISPSTAFKIGEKSTDPLEMYLADIYTVTANIVGIPSISIPCGLVDGLPVGMQIMGKHFQEKTILDLGYVYENDLLSSSNHSSFVSAFLSR